MRVFSLPSGSSGRSVQLEATYVAASCFLRRDKEAVDLIDVDRQVVLAERNDDDVFSCLFCVRSKASPQYLVAAFARVPILAYLPCAYDC